MDNDLVSIIIPCYNGEEYLKKTLECYLNQYYKNIEIFFINDGSTDKTEKIALEYKYKFENSGIKFYYIYQENQGQAAAINNVLKMVNGKFLTWPDSDDIITKDSIQKRVEFLKNNKEYGIVRNAVKICDFKTGKEIDEFRLNKKANENIFEDFLYCKNIFFSPVSYMVSVDKFKNANPNMEIYPSRAGQNLQMLLPIAYKYKCGYIDEYLCTYFIRDNSDSRNKYNTLESTLSEYKKHIDVLEKTLETMGVYEKYKKDIYIYFIRLKLNVAYKFENNILIKKFYNELNSNGKLTIKDRLKYFIRNNKLLNELYKKVKN